MIYAPLLLLIPATLLSKRWSDWDPFAKWTSAPKKLSREYFLGLNYLIENQPDKAIDEFVKLLAVDNETIEIHMTLGSLFRSRGEVDRAIRIHQNIMARPSLTRLERIQAITELGRDYLHAGMLDRAERLFLDVVHEHGPQRLICLEFLLSIYEQERDWQNAIKIGRQLSKSKEGMGNVIAHYYCELADSLPASNRRERESHLQAALRMDPQCVRANLMLGKMLTKAGKVKQAVKYLMAIKEQDRAYIGEAVDSLITCYTAIKQEKAMIAFWQSCLRDGNNVAVVLAMAKALRKTEGDRQAIEFLAMCMRSAPSLRVLDYLVDIYSDNSRGDALEKLLLLKGFIHDLLGGLLPYQCDHCGFSGSSLYWQCPGCRKWGCVRPIEGMLSDSMVTSSV